MDTNQRFLDNSKKSLQDRGMIITQVFKTKLRAFSRWLEKNVYCIHQNNAKPPSRPLPGEGAGGKFFRHISRVEGERGEFIYTRQVLTLTCSLCLSRSINFSLRLELLG